MGMSGGLSGWWGSCPLHLPKGPRRLCSALRAGFPSGQGWGSWGHLPTAGARGSGAFARGPHLHARVRAVKAVQLPEGRQDLPSRGQPGSVLPFLSCDRGQLVPWLSPDAARWAARPRASGAWSTCQVQGLLGGHVGQGAARSLAKSAQDLLASVESGALVGCVSVHTHVPSACEPWTWTDTCVPVFVCLRPPGQAPSAGLHSGLQGLPAPPSASTQCGASPSTAASGVQPWVLRRGRLAPRPRQVSELPSPRVLRPLPAAGAPTAGQDWRLGGALSDLGQGWELAGSCSACPVAGGREGDGSLQGRWEGPHPSSSIQPPTFGLSQSPANVDWSLPARRPRGLCCTHLPQSTSASGN